MYVVHNIYNTWLQSQFFLQSSKVNSTSSKAMKKIRKEAGLSLRSLVIRGIIQSVIGLVTNLVPTYLMSQTRWSYLYRTLTALLTLNTYIHTYVHIYILTYVRKYVHGVLRVSYRIFCWGGEKRPRKVTHANT